jgi:hypothetical protein
VGADYKLRAATFKRKQSGEKTTLGGLSLTQQSALIATQRRCK